MGKLSDIGIFATDNTEYLRLTGTGKDGARLFDVRVSRGAAETLMHDIAGLLDRPAIAAMNAEFLHPTVKQDYRDERGEPWEERKDVARLARQEVTCPCCSGSGMGNPDVFCGYCAGSGKVPQSAAEHFERERSRWLGGDETQPALDRVALLRFQDRTSRDAQEIERLRGLLVDPGSPAWEDARAVLVAELRKAGLGKLAERVAAAHAELVPSDIALNLIAQKDA